MFALVALVFGVGSIAFIVVEGSGLETALGPGPTASATPTPSPAPTPSEALAVTGDGPGGRSTPRPTATPAREVPGPRATDAPAPTRDAPDPSRPLSVEFPRDGDEVVSSRINVFGHGPGGVVVVRELADGSTQETAARPDGLWLMQVDLGPGENRLVFRIQGGDGEPLVVRVTHRPR